jgi:DNA segregation ATPase FtsK/SpoIIIE-like protein
MNVYIAEFMKRLGKPALLPSIEEDPKSVWITADDSPTGFEGYFVRQELPLKHQLIRDGSRSQLRFTGPNGVEYQIRAETDDDIADIMRTLTAWIKRGIVTWDEAFAGFARTTGEEWWRILRVAPDATRDEIEAAYKRQAQKSHPDTGGSHEAFLRLRRAYEEATSS